MRVLVTGASGQLGYDVCRELERRGVPFAGTSSRTLDITDSGAVLTALETYRPDAVIHCAAYTAVDRAEEEPERAFAVNETGTRNVAAACAGVGAKMIYISTDYVFAGAGEAFYETYDAAGPLNVYGRSKLAGEQAVRELLDRYFIVRISWVFGRNGNNFIKTMLRLAESRSEVRVVCDQIGSPTYTADLAPLLCDMTGTEKYGVYHATNEGVCSWAELAQEVFHRSGKVVHVEPILTAEYPTKAVRPLNSRLSKRALDEAGFSRLPCWQDALDRFLKELEGNKQTI